jgi:AcrR family transcriptional regulator
MRQSGVRSPGQGSMSGAKQQDLIAAKRGQILDAAALVFAEKGFHPATIRDVARQAGVADGTIYNYFSSKSDLLLGIFDRARAAIVQTNSAPAPGDLPFRDLLHSLLAQPLQALAGKNLALFRIIVSEMMVNAELRERYAAEILAPTLAVAEEYLRAQAQARGVSLRPDELRLTMRAISALVMGLLLQSALGDETLQAQWDALPSFIADLIATGLEERAK